MRIATFNVKHGAEIDHYIGHAKRVAEACQEIDADILALQEVDNRTLRIGFRNMAAMAAKACGMQPPFFAPTMRISTGSYGNALLVRGKIRDAKTITLGKTPRFRKNFHGRMVQFGYEPRNAIIATAQVEDQPITVATTHLSVQKAVNFDQLRTLLDRLSLCLQPQILMGDLNRRHDSVVELFDFHQMELANGPQTFPANRPNRAIDHIAVKGLSIGAVEVRRFPVSDHLALIAEVS